MDEKLTPESLVESIKRAATDSITVPVGESTHWFSSSDSDSDSDDVQVTDCETLGDNHSNDPISCVHLQLDWHHLNEMVQIYRNQATEFEGSKKKRVLVFKELSRLIETVEDHRQWPIEWYKVDTRAAQDSSIQWTDEDRLLQVYYHGLLRDTPKRLEQPVDRSMTTGEFHEYLQSVLHRDVLGGEQLSLSSPVDDLTPVLNGYIIQRLVKHGFVRDDTTENLYQAIQQALSVITKNNWYIHTDATTSVVRAVLERHLKRALGTSRDIE